MTQKNAALKPPMSPEQKRARAIIREMRAWWQHIGKNQNKPCDGRSPEERDFDEGVFAASELVRRYTGDNELSLAIHELAFCIRKQRDSGVFTKDAI